MVTEMWVLVYQLNQFIQNLSCDKIIQSWKFIDIVNSKDFVPLQFLD